MEQAGDRTRALLLWGGILAAAGLVVLIGASVWFGSAWAAGGAVCPGCPWWMMPGMMQPFGPGGFGGGPLWALLTFLGWILVLGGVVLLGIWLFRTLLPGAAPAAEDPLRVAQLRFARGEITAEEYERIRQELTKAA